MKYFVVVLFAAVCYARPEPPAPGYNYAPQQHQNHGAAQQFNAGEASYHRGGNQQFNSGSHHGGHQQQSAGPVQVTKHVYVHVPPPETEENFAPAAPPPPAQKHYKIIFIKAPFQNPARENFNSPQFPQTEEKTIVYVLVKRPDEQLNVDSAPLPQQAPSKPEVYFIKYKTKSDAQAHQQHGGHGQAHQQHGGHGQAHQHQGAHSFGSGTSSSFNLNQQHGGHAQAPDNSYGPPPLPNVDNTYGPPHHK